MGKYPDNITPENYINYLHKFETVDEYEEEKYAYGKPFVSWTVEDDAVNYNISYDELRNIPMTFKILTDGNIIWKATNTGNTITIEYSKNDGEWTSITSTTGGTSISVVSGDTIQFRGDNSTYAPNNHYNSFENTTCGFSVRGNIMSLVNSTDFPALTTLESAHTFYYLFNYCTGLTDASKLLLPATTLSDYCYSGMFNGCTSLTQAPELPATTLAYDCYGGMFWDCTSLTTAPELPATTLATDCYNSMFYGCTSLTTAPALPATTLAGSCYIEMFSNCTSLTGVPVNYLPVTALTNSCYSSMFRGCTSLTTAPALPAITLSDYCYRSMFYNCTSLTQAPELPATTLSNWCYRNMFEGCTSLNYIKCLATDISASNCTSSWVSGVASTGTFECPSSTSWSTGTSGIPSGWTRVDV